MAGAFSINTAELDRILSKFKNEKGRADKLALRKITQAVNIIYNVAHAKRPTITKAQAKKEGRRFQVSDPNAEAGVPVRTGALQASIKKEVQVKTNSVLGTIWTSSPYAAFIEFGTSKMPARPFMRPAIDLTATALKNMFAKKEEP